MKDSRIDLYNEFHKRYNELTQFIAQLPINQNFRGVIAVNFDTGLLWTREAINAINLDTPPAEEINIAS